MNTAEKIETIVMCYLTDRTTEGTLGSIVDLPSFANGACSFPACFRVECDAKTFIVRSTAIGWAVMFGPFVGEDTDLYQAAKMVSDTQAGGIASPLSNVVSINR